MEKNIDELSINTIRFLAVDAVEKAKSGHPGTPMGDAAMAYVLWMRFLKHNPKNPRWPGRDRFVLSAGHASMLLYALLHLTGYDLPLEELKNFRQWGSHTPGHPEYDPERGMETTTGPLGQGFGTGVGMAMAERYLAHRYNRPGFPLFDYNIYSLTSDGDMMEGISNEAASIAGHLGLGKLVYLYSDNSITIEGSTDLAFSEDVAKRFEALKWHVQKVEGNDLEAVAKAIERAKGETQRPSLIIARTYIGFGSPTKESTAEVHGAPLGPDETRGAKEKLGWPLTPEFHIPGEALSNFRTALEKGETLEREWNGILKKYAREYPELANEWKGLAEEVRGGEWVNELPSFEPGDGPLATRSASGKFLNAVAPKAPFLIGGSADLAPSTNTYLKGLGDFLPGSTGRNIHFGVREHAMGAMLNGMALSGAIVPYGGTFLIFSDYMKPAIRLASLMKLHVIYVFTHDSIGLGEDGPTHQPIEQLASLRAVPNLTVIRPSDATETVEAWKTALSLVKGPVAIVLTRQKVPIIDRKKYPEADNLALGAYVISDPPDGDPEIIIIATGSEVHLALGAYEELLERGVKARVVSMPSQELFEQQEEEYRLKVLPPHVKLRIAVEAGSPLGWHKYVGVDGEVIGITGFGASAPYSVIFEKYGFTVKNVVSRAMTLINEKRGHFVDGI
jgi:transketolase